MHKYKNSLKMVLPSYSVNESFARIAVAAFAAQLDPTIEEMNDIKTAVSEAVTNCIVHAYKNTIGNIYISANFTDDNVVIARIRDKGCGIEDIAKAKEPLFTTAGGERAGLGFAVMESFMDALKVSSKPNKVTTITMKKRIVSKNIND